MNRRIRMMSAAVLLACAIVSAADTSNNMIAVNAAPVFQPEYTDIFYRKKPRIYLDGEWRYRLFYCSQNDYTATVNQNRACFKGPGKAQAEREWQPILVPNFVDARSNSDKIGAMFLSRNFMVGEGASGKRLILTFTGIAWSPVVYINGQLAAEYRNLLPGWPTEFFQTDITHLIHVGQNVITVALFKFRKGQRLLTSGIYAPAYIDMVEPTYAANILITPCLPDTIRVKGTVVNSSDRILEAKFTAIVENWKDGTVSTILRLARQTVKPGANPVQFSVKINKPILWDVENPHLYSLKLLCGNKLIGWERFGLREFKAAGQNFILNGKKIRCFGIAAEEGNLARLMYVENVNPQFLNNGGDCLRCYLTMLKENNCNAIMRWPTFTEVMNNLADEIGILQFHMILPWKMYTDDMPLWIKRQIVDKKQDIPEFFSRGRFYETGKPDSKTQSLFANIHKYTSSFTALMAAGKARPCPPEIFDIKGRNAFLQAVYEKLGTRIRNHPSVVAILTGDEGFRSINQAFDMPVQRAALHSTCPGVLFSGVHSYSDTSVDLAGKRVICKQLLHLLDFVNPATSGIGGSCMRAYPWSMISQSLPFYTKRAYRVLGRKTPVFADEVFYYGELKRVCSSKWQAMYQKTVASLFPDRQKLDIATMITSFSCPEVAKTYAITNRHKRSKYLYTVRKKAGSNAWYFRTEMQLVGLCPELSDRNVLLAAVASRIKKMVESVRIYDQYMQGVGATTGPWAMYDMEMLKQLNAKGIGATSPVGKAFKHLYAPLFVCLDLYGKRSSMVAGETLNTSLYCFNNTRSNKKKITVKVTLENDKGKVFAMEISRPRLNVGKKISSPVAIPFDYDLPSGDYRIILAMSVGNDIVAKNSYELYVYNAAGVSETIACPETIYVYESYDPTTRDTFRRFLDSLRLKMVYVPRENLLDVTYYNRDPDKVKYLILSPHSLDSATADNMVDLKPWLEKGGQLLCLEQNYVGAFPWMTDYTLVRLRRKNDYALPAFGVDAMPIRYEDPLFHGLKKRCYWESFNNPGGEMYSYMIAPLTTEARMIGPDVSALSNPIVFGALIVDKKIGAGRCLVSQIEAVKALNHQDGVARKYLVNLIREWLKQR